MTPSHLGACSARVPATVRWNVSNLGLKKVRLEVNGVGARPVLWKMGAASGKAETDGPWGDDGFTVTLLSMNGVVLGRRTMTAETCKNP
jgi:hypothetical protein